MKVKDQPCEFCPYRQDVPSGVWGEEEYAKLRLYDGPTHEQSPMAFVCHATEHELCHGWAVTSGDDSLALRLVASLGGAPVEIPEPAVPLFATHSEAADHGERDIDDPSPEAMNAMRKLLKYRRLAAINRGHSLRRSR